MSAKKATSSSKVQDNQGHVITRSASGKKTTMPARILELEPGGSIITASHNLFSDAGSQVAQVQAAQAEGTLSTEPQGGTAQGTSAPVAGNDTGTVIYDKPPRCYPGYSKQGELPDGRQYGLGMHRVTPRKNGPYPCYTGDSCYTGDFCHTGAPRSAEPRGDSGLPDQDPANSVPRDFVRLEEYVALRNQRDHLLVEINTVSQQLENVRTERTATIKEFQDYKGTQVTREHEAVQRAETALTGQFNQRLSNYKKRITELETQVKELQTALNATQVTNPSDARSQEQVERLKGELAELTNQLDLADLAVGQRDLELHALRIKLQKSSMSLNIGGLSVTHDPDDELGEPALPGQQIGVWSDQPSTSQVNRRRGSETMLTPGNEATSKAAKVEGRSDLPLYELPKVNGYQYNDQGEGREGYTQGMVGEGDPTYYEQGNRRVIRRNDTGEQERLSAQEVGRQRQLQQHADEQVIHQHARYGPCHLKTISGYQYWEDADHRLYFASSDPEESEMTDTTSDPTYEPSQDTTSEDESQECVQPRRVTIKDTPKASRDRKVMLVRVKSEDDHSEGEATPRSILKKRRQSIATTGDSTDTQVPGTKNSKVAPVFPGHIGQLLNLKVDLKRYQVGHDFEEWEGQLALALGDCAEPSRTQNLLKVLASYFSRDAKEQLEVVLKDLKVEPEGITYDRIVTRLKEMWVTKRPVEPCQKDFYKSTHNIGEAPEAYMSRLQQLSVKHLQSLLYPQRQVAIKDHYVKTVQPAALRMVLGPAKVATIKEALDLTKDFMDSVGPDAIWGAACQVNALSYGSPSLRSPGRRGESFDSSYQRNTSNNSSHSNSYTGNFRSNNFVGNRRPYAQAVEQGARQDLTQRFEPRVQGKGRAAQMLQAVERQRAATAGPGNVTAAPATQVNAPSGPGNYGGSSNTGHQSQGQNFGQNRPGRGEPSCKVCAAINDCCGTTLRTAGHDRTDCRFCWGCWEDNVNHHSSQCNQLDKVKEYIRYHNGREENIGYQLWANAIWHQVREDYYAPNAQALLSARNARKNKGAGDKGTSGNSLN